MQRQPTYCGFNTTFADEVGFGRRKYELYIPEILCDGDETISAAAKEKYGSLPLLFAIHGFHDSPAGMKQFDEIGRSFDFIAVRPYGWKKSWNAKYCCGQALEHDIDDIGFFSQIIGDLEQSGIVNRDVVFGVGYSNGAYMVTHAAKLFRAIAPISGYQYDGIMQTNKDSLPKGLFQRHSLNDNAISYNGCCETSQCCCGVSSGSAWL